METGGNNRDYYKGYIFILLQKIVVNSLHRHYNPALPVTNVVRSSIFNGLRARKASA